MTARRELDPGPALAELSERAVVAALGEVAEGHDGPVYLVGGILRDVLLGHDSDDVDVAVAGDFDAFLHAVADRFDRRLHDLGDVWQQTRRMIWRGIQVDVSHLQGGLRRDLSRRDFTVNAMALRLPVPEPAGRGLTDPHDGLRDLAEGRIRHVSDRVLEDDPLRLLRAVRYATSLAGFELDPGTAQAVAARASLLAEVAAERVRDEWQAILETDAWDEGVAAAHGLGLGPVVPGSVRDLTAVEAWGSRGAAYRDGAEAVGLPEPAAQRLAAVLWCQAPGDVPTTSRRLREARWPRRLAATAARVAVWARRVEGVDGEEELIGWALEDGSAAAGAAALATAVAEHRGDRPPPGAVRLETYARRAGESPWLDGHRLRDWGLPEGPELGEVLEEARRGQVSRRWSGPEAALSWARRRVEELCEGAP